MPNFVTRFNNPEDFGTPHTIKDFRRVVIAFQRYGNGVGQTPTLDWEVEGQTGSVTGVATASPTAQGPNYFTFHLPIPRGRWIRRMVNFPNATDLGATAEEVEIVHEKVRRGW